MDLREYLSKLKQHGELQEVEGADWNLEIGAITELGDEKNAPAFLFDRIKDYSAGKRIAVNLTATPRRWNLVLGLPLETARVDLVRAIKDRLAALQPLAPVEVHSGVLLENIQEDHEVDLTQFPAPLWHELDGGRYIGTADMVLNRDPDGGWVNAGTYRLQLHDRNTLGWYMSPGQHGNLIRQKYWSRGQACPVAAVFGAHPLVWMPAFTTYPWGVEELAMAGGLLGRPLEVIRGPYTGLPLPAWGEIAIEGDCPPPEVESRKEGPFGEAPGYYGSGERAEPVIKVRRVMYRRDPIICGAPPLKPPSSGGAGTFLIRAAGLWQGLEKLGISGIKGVYQLRSGASRFLSVISIKQAYAGHSRQIGTAAMSVTQGAFLGRFTIVVDEDIDPGDEQDVLWAIATRCDPATSIQIVRGCWSTSLDPAIPPEAKARGEFTNSRAVLDACRPFHWRDQFPKVNRASDALRSKAISKWRI